MAAPIARQAVRLQVAQRRYFDVVEVGQDAEKVRTPIAQPDDSDSDVVHGNAPLGRNPRLSNWPRSYSSFRLFGAPVKRSGGRTAPRSRTPHRAQSCGAAARRAPSASGHAPKAPRSGGMTRAARVGPLASATGRPPVRGRRRA